MFLGTAERHKRGANSPARARRERNPFFASASSHEALIETSGPAISSRGVAAHGRPSHPQLGEAAFTNSKVGKLIINGERTVLWGSPTLSELVGGDSPLSVSSGRLAANGSFDQTRLEELIESAQADDRRHDMLLAAVAPGRGTIALKAKGCPGGEGRIAIELRELDEVFDFDLPDFRSLYGLTPVEHETLCAILSGLSVNEVAEQLGKSVLTVRTHVKHAYSKLNITSKEQLFAITLKLG